MQTPPIRSLWKEIDVVLTEIRLAVKTPENPLWVPFLCTNDARMSCMALFFESLAEGLHCRWETNGFGFRVPGSRPYLLALWEMFFKSVQDFRRKGLKGLTWDVEEFTKPHLICLHLKLPHFSPFRFFLTLLLQPTEHSVAYNWMRFRLVVWTRCDLTPLLPSIVPGVFGGLVLCRR